MEVVLIALAAVAILTAALARRAVARARISERRYRMLAAQWPETAIGLLDRDLRFALFEGDALMPQWRHDEVLGHTLADVIPAERIDELRPSVEAALAGETSSLEWVGVRSTTIFRIDVIPFRENGGEITHAMLAIRDIAEQKALQHSLEEQRGFLSSVLTQLGERVIVSDAEGKIVDFGARHTAGRTELHPLQWAEAFGLKHPDGQPFGPHEAPLLRALRGDEVRDVEMRVETPARHLGAAGQRRSRHDARGPQARRRRRQRRPDRVPRCRGSPAPQRGAAPPRRREHGRLRVRDRRAGPLDAPVGELDGRHRAQRRGHPRALLLGLVHPEDRAMHAHAFAPLLAGERADARLRHRFITTTGAERWAEVQVRAISGWDGLPTGFVGVMRDVTETQRAQQHGAAESAVMRLLSSAEGTEDMGRGLIAALGHELGWDGAELWQMSGDERLRRTAEWTAPGVRLDRSMRAGASAGVEVGDGFPGQAWMSRTPQWKSDTTSTLLDEGVADGIRSTAALPLRAAGVPMGVVVLVSRTPREPEPGLVRLLEAIGGHVTGFLQRRAAEGRAAE